MIYDKKFNKLEANKIADIIAKKKVIIYGASSRNEKLIDNVLGNKVHYICDKQEEKNGTLSFGIPVRTLEQLKNEDKENIVVFTVIRDYSSLSALFNALGINNYFYYDVKFGSIYIDYFVKKNIINTINNNFDVKKDFHFINFITDDKFFEPLINIIIDNFDMNSQAFVIYNINGTNFENKYGTWDLFLDLSKKYKNILLIDNMYNVNNYSTYSQLMYVKDNLYNAEKIILHSGFIDREMEKYFQDNVFLLQSKTEWIPWGGEQFIESTAPNMHKILNQCKTVCCCNDHIYLRIASNYSFEDYKQKRIKIAYNYYKIPSNTSKNDNTVRILLGFGARKNILFKESMEKLEKYKNEDIEIYCPLSYGDLSNDIVDSIVQYGKDLFGQKFKPVMEYIGYSEYPKFLDNMDIAIMPITECIGQTTIRLLMLLNKKMYVKDKEKTCPERLKTGYMFNDFDTLEDEKFSNFIDYKHANNNLRISKSNSDLKSVVDEWRQIYNVTF